MDIIENIGDFYNVLCASFALHSVQMPPVRVIEYTIQILSVIVALLDDPDESVQLTAVSCLQKVIYLTLHSVNKSLPQLKISLVLLLLTFLGPWICFHGSC